MNFRLAFALTLLISSSLCASAFAKARESHDPDKQDETVHRTESHVRRSTQPKTHRTESIAATPRNLTAGTFKQNIDHFGALPGQTFAQRYWMDSEYATSGADAPVIYHLCGEGDCTEDYFLHDNAIAWAKTLGAHLVYLEHRYYGQSLPFADLSAEHLAYLTLNNEIEDLATFQKWISNTEGFHGKWISVGGSYSGTVSALYRQAHPELVVGALAASAPMIAGAGSTEGTQSDVDELSSTDPSDDSGNRQWVYEACTSMGFWEASGATSNDSVFTPSTWLCGQLFGNAKQVNPKTYNQNYNAPFLANSASAPSNILFTYGSKDVWTQLGLSTEKNANPSITILVIPGAEHHYDLNAASITDSAAVKAARVEFVTLATQWLK
jgi:pimeloyl-ACP methyl ester carboxylesterase